MRHLPNLICLLRIALIWPIVIALERGQDLAALGLFVAAAVSDGLDGYLAKRCGWTSDFGRFLDPLADKLLLVVVFVACTAGCAAVSNIVVIVLMAIVFAVAILAPFPG